MNRQSSEKNVDLRVLEVLHISYNTGTFALSDMSALSHALGCCANISGNVYLYLCYNYSMTYVAITMQNFVSWYDISIIFHITSTEYIMCR